MFRRLANVIYNAVDVFAPPLPLQEEFITHWENIANYYTDKRSCGKTPIESTSIPKDLGQMLFLIEQEQNEFDADSPGPCVEYMLQHRLLETICVLARADSPPGMKKHVLLFISNLLEKSNYDLLPHVDVCLVIKDMISLCGEKLATPYENEEIYFIRIICQKLRDNTNLVNCFLSDTRKTNELPRTSYHEMNSSPRHAKKSSEHFPIIKSLMVLLQSPDRQVVELASECLVICVSLTNDKVIKAIVNSNFSSLTISHLCALYNNIPKTIKTSDIERAFFSEVDAKIIIPSSQRKLICFFKWIEFLNQLASASQELISEDMAGCFHSDFLNTVLYYDLINEDEPVAIFATSILSACYYQLSPSYLRRELSLFLVGELAEPERQEFSSHTVKNVLIKRCLCVRDRPVLGMTSLQLFEDLIRKPNDIILESLTICNLRSRRYYNMSLVDGLFFDEDSEAFASHYLNKEYDLTVDEVSPGDGSNVFAPDNIEKILHCFLQLMPEDFKACSPNKDTESGYDTYIKEAQKQFQECIFSCEKCDMPIQPLQAEFNLSDVESESSSQPEADATEPFFYEGSFLSMLFDNLEQMLHQRYEVNLQITSLISKLALIPHPNLHEYLLNPFLPLAPGTRSLFTVLSKIVKDIQVSVEFMPNFKKNLIKMRHILLTEDNEVSVQFESQRTLEAIIVLEEFCKELAAIIFTKYHAAAASETTS